MSPGSTLYYHDCTIMPQHLSYTDCMNGAPQPNACIRQKIMVSYLKLKQAALSLLSIVVIRKQDIKDNTKISVID